MAPMSNSPDDLDRLTPVDPSQMPVRPGSHNAAARYARPTASRDASDPESTVYMTAPATSDQAQTAPRAYGAALRAEQMGEDAAAVREARRVHATEPQPVRHVPSTVSAPLNAPVAEPVPYAYDEIDTDAPRPARSHRGVKIALGLVVAAYAGGVVAFSNLYYPNTAIAGTDVSLMTADAAEHIASSVGTYQLHVEGVGLDWTYTPAAGSFAVDASAAARSVLDNNQAFLWHVKLVSHLTSTGPEEATGAEGGGIAVTYDEAAFESELGAAIDQVNATRPGTFDAAGAYDDASGMFTVAKARSSQRINKAAIIEAAKAAVSRAQTELALDDSMYEEFARGATDEQLQAACDAANQIIGVDVTLKLGDKEIAVLDGATMTQWITFDENLNPQLAENGLTDWIRNLASTQLDTAGTERTYTRPDGKQVTIAGGTYGWVSDEAALAQLIQQAVANKQTGEIQIPTKQTAAQYNGMGGRDWGAYVDIDISEQHVRYYDANDQLIWESGCITGNPNTDHDTPTGIYAINTTEQNVQLTGVTDPETGEPEYISYVDYWMSFIGGAVGLHDADWQAASSFNDPSAYTWTGSHGCVNLPPAKAAELYNIIQLNDCVIVHY